MRILNWNTQWLSPRSRGGRFARVKEIMARFDADVICLTEARPETMPAAGHTITSEISGPGHIENRGGRKVVMWSRCGWRTIDACGSIALPIGRFLRAETDVAGQTWTVIGMCIPYHAYRASKHWGEQRLALWEGACRYLDALREHVLPSLAKRERTVLLGDFNMQIPPAGYPSAGSKVNAKRKETFAGWLIPTAGIQRRFIDHVAISADLRVESMHFISKQAEDGTRLSDHNGVCLYLTPA